MSPSLPFDPFDLFAIIAFAVIDCGTPPSSSHVQVTLRGGTKYQAIATYACSQSSGQRCLEGPSTRHCNADGKWSGKQPVCVGKYLPIF